MSLILTTEHVYASAISDAKKVEKFVQASVLPALKKLDANASTIEAITGLVSPQLANIERVAEAALAAVIKAIDDAGTTANAGGLSVSLDASLVSDIKAIIPAVKAQVSASAARAAAANPPAA